MSCTGVTAIDSAMDWVLTGLLWSETEAVNVKTPLVVGVPVIYPPALRPSPVGKVPDVIDHVYGAVPPAAESACEYAVPTVSPASDVVEILSAGAAMEMLNAAVWVSTGLLISETETVNGKVPLAAGVPVIDPPVLRLKPEGRLPDAMDQVYGAAPPLAESACEYAVPAVPAASDAVEMFTEVSVTVMFSDAAALCCGELESFAVAVNGKEPRMVGVPEMTPVELSERPGGRPPDEIAQL